MKKILDGLAALASEADAEGNIRVADQIDNLIKALAAWDPVEEGLEAQEKATIKMPPEVVVGKTPDQKKADILKMHEKARVLLQEIAEMFKAEGQTAPFTVPATNISGTQILDILKLANMGSPLTGWHDLMKRLKNIKGQVASHFSTGTASPFPAASKPVPTEVKRAGDDPGEFASIPTPTAGSGTASPATGEKGPPVPPVVRQT